MAKLFPASGPKQLGYAEATSAQASISTSELDVTGLTVTVTATGRPILIVADLPCSKQTNAGFLQVYIKEGATYLQTRNSTSMAISGVESVHLEAYVAAPSVGSHTYLVRAVASTATATVSASATAPASIRATEIAT